MADLNQTNANPASVTPQASSPVPNGAFLPASGSTPKSQSSSPWDEDVPAAETPASKPQTVMGTLAPNNAQEAEASTPFTVPENIEEKVGQKVSADQYITPKEEVPLVAEGSASAAATPVEPLQTASTNASSLNQSAVNPAVQNQAEQAVPLGPANQNSPEFMPQPAPSPLPPTQKKPNFLAKLLRRGTKENQKAISPPPAPTPVPFGQGIGVNPVNQKPRTAFAFLQNQRLVAVIGVIAFLAFIVSLTELGLISVGAEKVYGAIGLEKLWGGLSANPENALAISAVQMQKHSDFKIKGSMTLSIDQTMDSPISSPLFSVLQKSSVALLKDENIGSSQRAIQTAQFYGSSSSSSSGSTSNTNSDSSSDDVYNLYSNDNSDVDSSATDLGDDLSSATDSTSADDTTGTASEDSTNYSMDENGNTNESLVEGESSNIVDVKSTVSVKTSKEGISGDLSLDGGSQSASVNLMLQSDKFYVKSDSVKFAPNADPEKWLSYTLAATKDKAMQKDFFNISSTAGFSVKGKREGNEKVGSVRCYKYKIDSIELGDALSGLGISSDTVQNISGEVWIGIGDKLIRRIDLKIITPISSSISSINLSFQFSDYDVANKITFPDSSEVVEPSVEEALPATATAADRDAKRKTDVGAILDALKRYKADNGSYPVSKDLLKLNASGNMIEKVLVPKYLTALPADPTDGWYYAYKSNEGKNCSISARLEDASDADGQTIGGVLLYLKYNDN